MKRQNFCRVLCAGVAGVMLIGMPSCAKEEKKRTDYTDYSVPENIVGPGANGDEKLKLPDYQFEDKTIHFLGHVNYVYGEDKTLEEFYGARVESEVVPPDQRISRLQQLVNSGQAPDLFEYDLMPSLITRGYVQPMTQFINLDSPLWSGAKDSIERMRFQDDLYCVPTDPSHGDCIWYNKEIFRNYDLKTPRELLEEGNWTWDTFRETAMKLTIRETDGSVSQWGAALLDNYLFINSTGEQFINLINGAPVNSVRSEKIARATNFCTGLYTVDNCLYPGANATELFMQGKVAMFGNNVGSRVELKDMLKEGSISFVPPPRDPEADAYYLGEGLSGYYIPANCDNPVGAAAAISCGRYNALDKNAQKRNVEMLEKECNWNQEYETLFREMWGEPYTGMSKTWIVFGLGDYNGDFFTRPRNGEPWATIAEELYPKIESKIKHAYNGT